MKTSDWFIETGDCEKGFETLFVDADIKKVIADFYTRIKANPKRNYEIWSQDYANTAQGYCPFMRWTSGQLHKSGLANISV